MTSMRQPGFGSRLPAVDHSPAARLLRAWQQGQEPDLETFVAGLGNPASGEVAALIRIDLAARWRRNDPRPAEDYFVRFPTVAADAELAVDVIYAEFLAREEAGQRPELAEYQQRFARFGNVLAEQIGLHDALETVDDAQLDSVDAAPGTDIPQPANDVSPLEPSYEIIEQIGSGGMGVVYKARQGVLNRFVALKMVRAVDAGNHELLERFRSEARMVAALRHPHIVQVHDYGEHDGLPYIAMELVEGGSLADRLDGAPWRPRSAAALMLKLARAAHYAHERGVIHRDLKPANVLIASESDELDVKITDFGLAKFFLDESSHQTRSNAFLGTPSYMAPEQAQGNPREISPAADIYSLGAILYELLTGQPPFRGESAIETLRLLLSSEPVSVHRLAPRVSRDLATICEKCLQGEVHRRYASAAELCADLERYLSGRPIQARPIGVLERGWRWCRRNPLLAVALGSVALLLVGIAVISLWYSSQLSRELAKTRLAEKSEHAANQSAQLRLWDAYLSEAAARNRSRQVGQRFAALKTIEGAIGLLDQVGRNDERQLQLRNAVLSSVVLSDFRTVRKLGRWPSGGYRCDMSTSADCYIVAAEDKTLSGHRLSDGQLRWSVECAFPVTPVLSRDGRFAAAIGDRETKVWRVDGREPEIAWEAARAGYLSFAPGGEQAAYDDPQAGMRLVEAATGNVVRSLGKGHSRSQFVFHPATRRIAVCGTSSVQVIDWDSGELALELPLDNVMERRLAWHPSGQYVAVWGAVGIGLWDLKSGEKVATFAHRGVPAQLSFNRDGSILASQSLWDARLLFWDTGTGRRLLDVPDYFSRACDAAADDGILFVSDDGNHALLSEVTVGASSALSQAFDVPLGYWYRTAVSPEGRIAAFTSEGGLELWDLRTKRRIATSTCGRCNAEFDNAGTLYLGCNAGIYRFPRAMETRPASESASHTGTRPIAPTSVIKLGPPEKLVGPIVATSLELSSSGEGLLFQNVRGDWEVMRLGSEPTVVRLETKHDPRKGAVSHDNRYVAIANWEQGGAAVWDGRSGKHLADLAIGRHGQLQFSPDGRFLAATPDGVTLWNSQDWRRIAELHAHGSTPTGLGIAFSPDSRALAVGELNGILRLVDPSTGKDWARWSRWDLNVASVMAFSPDQRWLVTSSADERSPARVWNLVDMRRELAARGLDVPSDVLRVADGSSAIEGPLEVLLDDGGLFPRRPTTEDDHPSATGDKPR